VPVNVSLLGICVVDAWILHSGAHGTAAELTQNQFYEDLAAELIDNTFDTVGLRARGAPVVDSADRGVPPLCFGVGIHLNPTLKRRTGSSRMTVTSARSARAGAASAAGRRMSARAAAIQRAARCIFVVPRRVGHALTSTCVKCTIWTFRPWNTFF